MINLMNNGNTDKSSFSYIKYSYIFFISFSLIILSYFLIRVILGFDNLFPVGENMVTTEVPHQLFFKMKPITWFVLFFISGWIIFFETEQDKINRILSTKRRFLYILTFILIFISGYEVIYNFSLWSGLMAVSSILSTTTENLYNWNPDLLVNPYPNPNMPINLVFATKIVYLIFFLSVYTNIYINKMEKKYAS